LTLVNLVAILLIGVFAAVVYDRLAIDRFWPPIYSIRLRPSQTWHHADFVISPWYGFDVAFDGRSIFNYSNSGRPDAGRHQNDRWNSEDRPRLVALYLEIPRGVERVLLDFCK
jgi:hypothetical protein